jgi:iron complex outermembrane recepter protein
LNARRFVPLLAAALAFAPAAPARASSPGSAATPDTLGHVVRLPEIEVSTTRLDARAPLARATIERDELRRRDAGQDTPMLLATLPGAYAYSDAGNGIGYSYLSVRGFPQRRISVLVDGVPLNDPESHEVWWIDHPDLVASTREVQLQRGVGSALYGGASLGGTVAIETAPFSDSARSAASVSYGSWETKRLMLETSSGRLPGGWSTYARYSRIETQGYRERSWSRLWSYSLAARRTLATQSFRLTLFGGPEETHLAYLGVPRDYLEGRVTGDVERDRRYNPITYANERDHYFEPHYVLAHDWTPARRWRVSQTLFWFDGRGFYDESRPGSALSSYRLSSWWTPDLTLAPESYYAHDEFKQLVLDTLGRAQLQRFDLVRRRTVANRHYGWLPRVRVEHARGALTVGGELRAHDGRHWGEIVSGTPLPPGTSTGLKYYDYHPRTFSASLYAREEWTPEPRVTVTADLGWRHQAYHMRDDHFDGVRFDQTYDFALPRLGVTVAPDPTWSAFLAWSASGREPAFRDLYDAEGPGSLPLYRVRDAATNHYADPLIRPEHVNDWEAGLVLRGEHAGATVNLFRMGFRDELVYAGQYDTDLGYPVLGNAARSVHRGAEVAARALLPLRGGMTLQLDGNATLSENYFVEYHESYGPTAADQVSYDGRTLALFPTTIANLAADLAWRGGHLGLEARYAGRMYLDNTESADASIGPRTVLDAEAGWALPAGGSRVALSVRVANLLDTRYAAGGYLDWETGEPAYIPAATRSVTTQVNVGF